MSRPINARPNPVAEAMLRPAVTPTVEQDRQTINRLLAAARRHLTEAQIEADRLFMAALSRHDN